MCHGIINKQGHCLKDNISEKIILLFILVKHLVLKSKNNNVVADYQAHGTLLQM